MPAIDMPRVSRLISPLLVLVLGLETKALAAPHPVARSQAATASVQITFVGELSQDPELRSVIDELLTAQGEPFFIDQSAQLREADLLDEQSREEAKNLHIWVTLPTQVTARLWFSVPALGRFLVRELPLPQGLDAVAREQLGQVIEASVTALRGGDHGIDRNDAQRAFREQEARQRVTTGGAHFDTAASAKGVAPTTGQVTLTRGRIQVSNDPPDTLRFSPYLGLGYAAARNSGALGFLHGPSAEIGGELLRPRHIFGLLVTGQWNFPQSFEDARARLELRSKIAAVLLSYRDKSLTDFGFASKVGLGTEFTEVTPSHNELPTFVPRSAYRDVTYQLRLRAGAHGEASHFAWALNAGLDICLSKTDYHIETTEGKTKLFALAPLRPGFEASFALK